jgi:putative hydrolase of the HAD superfamily
MKAALFDIDGVLLERHGYFSEHVAKKQGLDVESVAAFFKNEFRQAQKGIGDLKELLAPYLPAWRWEGDSDSFLKYWHETDFHLNHEVFVFVDKLRAQGVRCFIASGQDPYRGAFIQNHPEFRDRFEQFFYSFELGVPKSNQEFFQKVIAEIGVSPADILYIDDDQKSIESAASLGIQAKLFTSVASLPNE